MQLELSEMHVRALLNALEDAQKHQRKRGEPGKSRAEHFEKIQADIADQLREQGGKMPFDLRHR